MRCLPNFINISVFHKMWVTNHQLMTTGSTVLALEFCFEVRITVTISFTKSVMCACMIVLHKYVFFQNILSLILREP